MNRKKCDSDVSSSFEFPRFTVNCRSDRNAEKQFDLENEEEKRNGTSSMDSFKSTLLAGHAVEPEPQSSTDNSYKSAKSNALAQNSTSLHTSSDSCRSEALSIMNKPINLRFDPQSDLDLSTSSHEAISSEVLKKNTNKLDTNHNIKGDRNTYVFPKSNLKPRDVLSVLSCIDECPEMTYDKTVISNNKIMKRLSEEFVASPTKFTEHLMTIIDESESSYLGPCEEPTVNFCHIPKEFRNVSKFIQDESMPEWAPSLCMNTIHGTSTLLGDNTVGKTKTQETIPESPQTPPSTHILTTKKIYRKTPKNIFKNTSQTPGSSLYMNVLERAAGRETKNKANAIGSPTLNDSSFTYWERYCEEIYGSPRVCQKKIDRRLSISDISHPTKEEIMIVCEEQLRSLDDSESSVDHEDEYQGHSHFDTFDSHPGQHYQDRNIATVSSSIRGQRYGMNVETLESTKVIENEEDDLAKSLMQEIAKKRQRCFDTIKTMQEIEKEAEDAQEKFSEVTTRHDVDVEKEFLKTIMSCIEYRNYLKQTKQNIDVKRFETLSLDSGIDTRSISGYNKARIAPSIEKNTKKQSLKCTTSIKSSRPGNIVTQRTYNANKVSSTNKENNRLLGVKSNFRERTPIKANQPSVVMRQKTPVSLKVSRAVRSRSRSAEKLTPQRITFRSPKYLVSGGIRTAEKVSELRVPENVTSRQLANKDLNLRVHKDVDHNACAMNTPKITPRRNKNPSPKNRFFVTPGKSVPVNKTKKSGKIYFPGMDDMNSQATDRLMRTLQAPGIYRQGYNTVISPVRTYIHGTDMNLVQNVRAETNKMLLTPTKDMKNNDAVEEKLKFKLSAKTSTPQQDGRKHCQFDQIIDSPSESDTNDENEPKSKFVLPKLTYKPSSQVNTVKETPKYLRCARTRGLFEPSEKRVVIRHEKKRIGEHENNQVPENICSSTDESIHVVKLAKKTKRRK